jgi:hypothetical protein
MAVDGANAEKLADKMGWFAWAPDSRSLVCFSPSDHQLAVFDLAKKQKRLITNEEGTIVPWSINVGAALMAERLRTGGCSLPP